MSKESAPKGASNKKHGVPSLHHGSAGGTGKTGPACTGGRVSTAVVAESDDVDETAIKAAITSKGFELLHDKLEELVESIKVAVINLIYSDEISSLTTNLSTYLAEKLGKDYSTISTAFKACEGVALNRYIVLQKVERVKELLTYDELPLSAIATKLGYKSLQHLSRQFKEVAGTTLNRYKNEGGADRHPIDNLC
ncbi:hypothetical protein GCM10028895_54830 [Pontibacter rugosus]